MSAPLADDWISIDADALAKLPAGSLFYPSAGPDTDLPINLFRRHVTDFWFIDSHAYSENGQPPVRDAECVRQSFQSIPGTTICNQKPFVVDVWTRDFDAPGQSEALRVNYCRSRGYDAFRVLFMLPRRPLSVFFYRGDSSGESGSGFYWLRKPRLRNILDVLRPGGLIVSDGSNADRRLAMSHRERITGLEARRLARSFRYHGREFTCVGYAGHRYGPTLVWQVWPLAKSMPSTDDTAA